MGFWALTDLMRPGEEGEGVADMLVGIEDGGDEGGLEGACGGVEALEAGRPVGEGSAKEGSGLGYAFRVGVGLD